MSRREVESEENPVFNSGLKGDAYLQNSLLESTNAGGSHLTQNPEDNR